MDSLPRGVSTTVGGIVRLIRIFYAIDTECRLTEPRRFGDGRDREGGESRAELLFRARRLRLGGLRPCALRLQMRAESSIIRTHAQIFRDQILMF
jgi:hypothetical protein